MSEQPGLPPITEEDKPAMEATLRYLVRLRKRQTSHNSDVTTGTREGFC